MKKLLSVLTVGAAIAAAFTPASAQVNTVPQVGVYQGYVSKATYRAVSIGLVPAASATDIFCIAGSATKTVKVQELRVGGSAGTLITTPVTVLRRASVDTGGTAAGTTANPANTIGKMDSSIAAATATLIAYTANPTVNDSSPTYLATSAITFPVTSAATSAPGYTFAFGNYGAQAQPLVLRGAAEQACVNLGGASISSGVLGVTIQWTEE